MPESKIEPPQSGGGFSWERWLMEGLRALRATLFRYGFGLPDEFWTHLDRAAHELLMAARILLKTLRKHYTRKAPPEPRGPIDINWDEL
jgi:hypothetical protein